MNSTDAQLTSFGGWSVLGLMAELLNFPQALSAASVKWRARHEQGGDATEPDRLASGGH